MTETAVFKIVCDRMVDNWKSQTTEATLQTKMHKAYIEFVQSCDDTLFQGQYRDLDGFGRCHVCSSKYCPGWVGRQCQAFYGYGYLAQKWTKADLKLAYNRLVYWEKRYGIIGTRVQSYKDCPNCDRWMDCNKHFYIWQEGVAKREVARNHWALLFGEVWNTNPYMYLLKHYPVYGITYPV